MNHLKLDDYSGSELNAYHEPSGPVSAVLIQVHEAHHEEHQEIALTPDQLKQLFVWAKECGIITD